MTSRPLTVAELYRMAGQERPSATPRRSTLTISMQTKRFRETPPPESVVLTDADGQQLAYYLAPPALQKKAVSRMRSRGRLSLARMLGVALLAAFWALDRRWLWYAAAAALVVSLLLL